MEEAFERLKCDHEEVMSENEIHQRTIEILEEKLKILHDEINGDIEENKNNYFEVKVNTKRRNKLIQNKTLN